MTALGIDTANVHSPFLGRIWQDHILAVSDDRYQNQLRTFTISPACLAHKYPDQAVIHASQCAPTFRGGESDLRCRSKETDRKIYGRESAGQAIAMQGNHSTSPLAVR